MADELPFDPKLAIRDRVITLDDCARNHELLRKRVSDPNAGLFGPDSMMWRMVAPLPVVPHMLIHAGLLEQVIPEIMFGIMGSVVLEDYAGRVSRVYNSFMSWFVEDLDTALKVSRKINGYHSMVGGMAPENCGHMRTGQPYRATEELVMQKTVATQVIPIKQLYEILEGPLTKEEADRYYEECKIFSMLFGIDEELVPGTDWDSYEQWWMERVRSGEFELYRGAKIAFGSVDGDGPKQPLLSRVVTNWYMSLEMNLLPDEVRVLWERRSSLGKPRPLMAKVSWFVLTNIYKRLPKGIITAPRMRAAQRRVGTAGETLRGEEWVAGKMRHPFGSATPTLTTPSRPELAPNRSSALTLRPR
ncbi:oxygenase MpaB family protein [Nocardia sp. NPDC004711]